jgi:hypothetical protein
MGLKAILIIINLKFYYMIMNKGKFAYLPLLNNYSLFI